MGLAKACAGDRRAVCNGCFGGEAVEGACLPGVVPIPPLDAPTDATRSIRAEFSRRNRVSFLVGLRNLPAAGWSVDVDADVEGPAPPPPPPCAAAAAAAAVEMPDANCLAS